MPSVFRSTGLLAMGVLSYFSIAVANPVPNPHTPSLPLPVTLLRSFGPHTWAENIALRSNGQILVTQLYTPILQQVDPANRTAPITIHTFNTTAYAGLLGITEVTPDVFYVAVQAPYNEDFSTTSPNAIFKVDLTKFATQNGSIVSPATVTHVVDLPESGILNGLVTLDSKHILVANSFLGVISNVDIECGTYTIPLNISSLKSTSGVATPIGVNGLKFNPTKPSYLYFTNLAQSTLSRVRIAPVTALPIGDSELVTNVPTPDDFAVRKDGTIFIMGNAQDTLFMLKPGAKVVEAVAGSNTSTVLAGVTAGAFGRLRGEQDRLYMSTGGAPLNVSATVSYVETSGL
ncbi:quino amine dehydrogenase beta chain protein [Rutstroemia sp. NJR-2017a WRK4]|nr:quino amine dehydrogenase beta chain protein [Rutstroemia sp. NJR-2017a WRK4]